MKTRKIGSLEVSTIGMGCMGFSHGYGSVPDEDYAIEAIRGAYENGCTFFDTSEVYGKQMFEEGHNERLVGKAIKPFRKDIVLATKFFVSKEEIEVYGSLVEEIRAHLRKSMGNLKTDYIDLYYLHRINPEIPVEDVAACMGVLIDEGLIKGWGLSQVTVDTLMRAHHVTPVSAVQSEYSIMERAFEEDIIPACLENNIGFVAFSPIASGFLSGNVDENAEYKGDDIRKIVPRFKKENVEANQPILNLITQFARDKGASNAQISIAWMLHKYPNVVPIPGSKNKGRIIENLNSSDVTLTDEEFEAIEKSLSQLEVHGVRSEWDQPS